MARYLINEVNFTFFIFIVSHFNLKNQPKKYYFPLLMSYVYTWAENTPISDLSDFIRLGIEVYPLGIRIDSVAI